ECHGSGAWSFGHLGFAVAVDSPRPAVLFRRSVGRDRGADECNGSSNCCRTSRIRRRTRNGRGSGSWIYAPRNDPSAYHGKRWTQRAELIARDGHRVTAIGDHIGKEAWLERTYAISLADQACRLAGVEAQGGACVDGVLRP